MAKTDWHNPATRARACRAILKRANWEVREYEPGDDTQILQLCRRVLGLAPTPVEWHWRMFQNPAGRALSLVTILKDSGRVVGHLAAVPIDLNVGGVIRKLFFLVDSVVDPAHQGRGIHAVLTMTSSQKVCDAFVGFLGGLPNMQAYGPNLKMGGTQIFTVPIYFKVLDWRAVVRTGLHSNFLARIAGFLSFQRTRPLEKSTSFTLEEVRRFDDKLDEFWGRVGQRFGISAMRTSNLLNWRYFDRPDSIYTVFSVSADERWLGYVVLRLLEKWGLRLGTVVDLFFDPECKAAGQLLLHCAEEHFRDNRADVMWSLFAGPPVYRKVLRQAGFFRTPPFKGVRQFHFVADFVTIDSVRPDLLERDGALLRQEDEWFFSLGDTDLA